MLRAICALAAGTEAKFTSNAALQIKALRIRICDSLDVAAIRKRTSDIARSQEKPDTSLLLLFTLPALMIAVCAIRNRFRGSVRKAIEANSSAEMGHASYHGIQHRPTIAVVAQMRGAKPPVCTITASARGCESVSGSSCNVC